MGLIIIIIQYCKYNNSLLLKLYGYLTTCTQNTLLHRVNLMSSSWPWEAVEARQIEGYHSTHVIKNQTRYEILRCFFMSCVPKNIREESGVQKL